MSYPILPPSFGQLLRAPSNTQSSTLPPSNPAPKTQAVRHYQSYREMHIKCSGPKMFHSFKSRNLGLLYICGFAGKQEWRRSDNDRTRWISHDGRLRSISKIVRKCTQFQALAVERPCMCWKHFNFKIRFPWIWKLNHGTLGTNYDCCWLWLRITEQNSLNVIVALPMIFSVNLN